jgi:hypothetical protein
MNSRKTGMKVKIVGTHKVAILTQIFFEIFSVGDSTIFIVCNLIDVDEFYFFNVSNC